MFRKPKRKMGQQRRKLNENDEDNEEDPGAETTTVSLLGTRKKVKPTTAVEDSTAAAKTTNDSKLHAFQASNNHSQPSHADRATSDNVALPTATKTTTNPFHAGPLKAARNIRVTARFDYQPDVCKDYKETGFCGFGDSCIYLHDRGDYLTGWQLEEQWEQEQAAKKKQEQLDAFANGGVSLTAHSTTTTPSNKNNNDLPFACFLCRQAFRDPVVTNCGHYFCQNCIVQHVQQSSSDECPVCHQETHRVFHAPVQLLAQRKRVLGREQDRLETAWQLYLEQQQQQEN